MEPRGLVAEWDAAKQRVTVSGVCKVPFNNRRALAQMMELPEASVRMVEYDVGGGFGARGEFYPEDFLIPFAARVVGRPVKWIEDRRENLMSLSHARDAACDLEIACSRDGTILALRGHAYTDLGAYVRTNGATASRNISQIMSGPYRIPHVRMDVTMVVTNKTPSGTYRGPGRFESDFCRERLFDMVAADLGIDRVEFRRRNLIAEADMPYALAKVHVLDIVSECDSGDYQMTLDRCLAEFNWAERSKLQGQADRRPLSRHRHRLLSRRRRHRAAGECAARHRGRRQDRGLSSARRRSARASRRCLRRSPPTRSNCRWSASTMCSTARPIMSPKVSARSRRAPSSWAATPSSMPPIGCAR